MTTEERLRESQKVTKEEFLSSIPSEDRQNITLLVDGFEKTMTHYNRKGALVVVGGILNKPQPRKDIDIVVVLERTSFETIREPNETLLDMANKEFVILKNLILKVTREIPDIKIISWIDPCIDEEYGNPSILKHEGSIIIAGSHGLPIELIRSPKRKIEDLVSQQKGRYSIIAKV